MLWEGFAEGLMRYSLTVLTGLEIPVDCDKSLRILLQTILSTLAVFGGLIYLLSVIEAWTMLRLRIPVNCNTVKACGHFLRLC